MHAAEGANQQVLEESWARISVNDREAIMSRLFWRCQQFLRVWTSRSLQRWAKVICLVESYRHLLGVTAVFISTVHVTQDGALSGNEARLISCNDFEAAAELFDVGERVSIVQLTMNLKKRTTIAAARKRWLMQIANDERHRYSSPEPSRMAPIPIV